MIATGGALALVVYVVFVVHWSHRERSHGRFHRKAAGVLMTVSKLPHLHTPLTEPKKRALASYTIRKMQTPGERPKLSMEFFNSLENSNLPTPTDMMDNLLLMLADEADGRPGMEQSIVYADEKVLGTIGAVEA